MVIYTENLTLPLLLLSDALVPMLPAPAAHALDHPIEAAFCRFAGDYPVTLP